LKNLARAAGIALFFAPALSAASFDGNARGTTAGVLLRMPPSPRSAALGEVRASLSGDASAVLTNPAALTDVRRLSVSLAHSPYLEDTGFGHVTFAQKMGFLAIGGGVQYLSAGSLTRSDSGTNALGNFKPGDAAAVAGGALKIGALSLGGAFKWVRSEVDQSATAMAVDLGLTASGGTDRKWRLGATATNLGTRLDFGGNNEFLPQRFAVGAAVKIEPNWTFLADGMLRREGDAAGAFGAELSWPLPGGHSFALRGGYNTILRNPSAGVGITIFKMTVDYALRPFADLGMNHFVSLGFQF
jgi:hypothetical protein